MDSTPNLKHQCSPFAYMQDECSVQFSYPYFKQFMDDLDQNDKLGTVILSCPDLDYQTVAIDSERKKLSQSFDRGYILVSDIDSPLELSRALHGYTRLGRPALPSAKSLFWGTFGTSSIPNIVSTAAHAPELLARRALRRIQSGFMWYVRFFLMHDLRHTNQKSKRFSNTLA
ncbi:MAG: alpha/beta hydrolase [Candidatus Melainabacteria bacterium]|nr:MAG: alpha/beta hydrolase [Candidatus Melainabacteria bacterium]